MTSILVPFQRQIEQQRSSYKVSLLCIATIFDSNCFQSRMDKDDVVGNVQVRFDNHDNREPVVVHQRLNLWFYFFLFFFFFQIILLNRDQPCCDLF